ncbi:MAG: hypothetical protein E6R04_11695 [Spirochaetes bacterium]|nr:MAG: hypothetical protein E6R04_11695 [Spirochaetota bacterium]
MARIHAALAAVLVATGIGLAPPASAAPGCVQQPWWYGSVGRMTTRTICDGPQQADGSWRRCREFYAAAYIAPGYWISYGWSGSYYPPRAVPEFRAVECYPVTPATVLPDEPEWVA